MTVNDPNVTVVGLIAGVPQRGYKTHVYRDQPGRRVRMGPGNMVLYGRPICAARKDGTWRLNLPLSDYQVVGGPWVPTEPDVALGQARSLLGRSACERCQDRFDDETFVIEGVDKGLTVPAFDKQYVAMGPSEGAGTEHADVEPDPGYPSPA